MWIYWLGMLLLAMGCIAYARSSWSSKLELVRQNRLRRSLEDQVINLQSSLAESDCRRTNLLAERDSERAKYEAAESARQQALADVEHWREQAKREADRANKLSAWKEQLLGHIYN